MKKAFTLFEFVIAMVIFSALFALLFKPLGQMYNLHYKEQKNADTFLDLNLALLSLEKIMQKCLNLEYKKISLECNLIDEENILFKEKQELSIAYSGLILKNNKGEFYSPKSYFVDDFTNPKKGALLNFYQFFQNKVENKFFVYDLTHSKLETIELLGDNKLKSSFTGFYLPLQARASFYKNGKDLIYELNSYFGLKQKALFLENISDFSVSQRKGYFILKLCKNELCLQKVLKK